MSIAYITQIDYLKQDLEDGLEFIDWKSKIKKGDTVFIKPNLTWPFYTPGVTTNPEIIRNLIEIIRDRAGRVIVGESDGGNNQFSADDCFKEHKLNIICNELGVELVNLTRTEWTNVEGEIQGKKVKVTVPKFLLTDIDCFISVPVLKVHVMTGVSISMKNLWGCFPDPLRCLSHKYLDYRLALLTKILKPQIIVVDGTYALNNHGPMFGTPVNLNLLIVSNNPVVADSIGAGILGMSPKRIRFLVGGGLRIKNVNHVALAADEGLGPKNIDDIKINQDWRKFVRKFEVHKTFMDRCCMLPFNSTIICRLIFDSKLKNIIFKISDVAIRNKTEMDMVNTCKDIKSDFK